MSESPTSLSIPVGVALLAAAGIVLCGLIAWPFLPALVWAFTLAVVAMPLQRWLQRRTGRPALNALVGVLVVLVAIVLPALFIGDILLTELRRGVEGLSQVLHPGDWRRYAPVWAIRSGLVDWLSANVIVDETAQ